MSEPDPPVVDIVSVNDGPTELTDIPTIPLPVLPTAVTTPFENLSASDVETSRSTDNLAVLVDSIGSSHDLEASLYTNLSPTTIRTAEDCFSEHEQKEAQDQDQDQEQEQNQEKAPEQEQVIVQQEAQDVKKPNVNAEVEISGDIDGDIDTDDENEDEDEDELDKTLDRTQTRMYNDSMSDQSDHSYEETDTIDESIHFSAMKNIPTLTINVSSKGNQCLNPPTIPASEALSEPDTHSDDDTTFTDDYDFGDFDEGNCSSSCPPSPMNQPGSTGGFYSSTKTNITSIPISATPTAASSASSLTKLSIIPTTTSASATSSAATTPASTNSTASTASTASTTSAPSAKPTVKVLTSIPFTPTSIPISPTFQQERHRLGTLTIENKTNSNATEVRRTAHFTFNPATGAYTGAPPEWTQELRKKFGLPIQLSRASKISHYHSLIPDVLLLLRKQLLINGGLMQKGIFRLAPDAGESSKARSNLDDNTFDPTQVTDVNVYSNLIKVWFRELPARILDCIGEEFTIDEMLKAETHEQVESFIYKFKEPHQSILLWVLDLCADISTLEPINAMSATNLAIVFAPNMYRLNEGNMYPSIPPVAAGNDGKKERKEKKDKKNTKKTVTAAAPMIDPQATITLCKKYTVFFQKAIEWRRDDAKRVITDVSEIIAEGHAEYETVLKLLDTRQHTAFIHE